jgi:hypothetical protein
MALVIETLETAQKNLLEIVENPKKFIPQKIPKDYQALNVEALLRAHVSIESLRNFLTEVPIDLTSKKTSPTTQ